MTLQQNLTAECPPALDLSHLNAEQRAAVEATEGPLLVLAGAGTGKTRVLTTRIAHILNTGRAFPGQILAVTFTNKAAAEMSHRIDAIVGNGTSAGLWLGTFHSVALRILRRHTALIGLPSDFSILDPDDQERVLKQILLERDMDIKRTPPRMFAAIIASWKDKALTPAQAAEIGADRTALKIYQAYQERLLQLGAADFGDLLMHCVTLLSQHPDILADYQRRFRYILVDEYQDTNVAQYLWLKLLAAGSRNICCVGDDDQSIYGWRGAEIENILRFERDFVGAKVVRLEQNYRSTPDILAAASGLIAYNRGRLGKTLHTASRESTPVQVVAVWDERAEAAFIAAEIEALQLARKQRLDTIAILVRAGHQTRALEECFMAEAIPYRIIGGLRFYERLEIRDAIAYLRATFQPQNDLALLRIINVPKRGMGEAGIAKIRAFARERNIPLAAAIPLMAAAGELKGKAKDTLLGLMADFARWREMLTLHSHVEVTETILKESGYLTIWKSEKTPEAQGRLENLEELLAALAGFESLPEFLEHISLVMDGDDKPDEAKVSIMTMHGAKGLEFETVFLAGWEEGLFPSQRAMDEKGGAGLEEERRLAYVGITRARRQLFISFAANRFVYGKSVSCIPSRFIDEIPAENTERLNMSGIGVRR